MPALQHPRHQPVAGRSGRAVYLDDPMCEAVERAVDAGIVVVAAAGNRGKDAEGRSVDWLIDLPASTRT